jgi:hypothetical protein
MYVRKSLRPRSIMAFLRGLPLSFQRQAAGDLDAVYHFTFTGKEPADRSDEASRPVGSGQANPAKSEATVTIRAGTIKIETGLNGICNLHLIADAQTWLGFLAKEKNLVWALLTRKIRLRGNPKWLLRCRRCSPLNERVGVERPVPALVRASQDPFSRVGPRTTDARSPATEQNVLLGAWRLKLDLCLNGSIYLFRCQKDFCIRTHCSA